MGNVFKGGEIVKIGIQIEKNGYDFYKALADSARNFHAQETFKYLAGEEKKHIASFEKLLDSVESYESTEAYPGEYQQYVKALADEHIFTKANKGKEIAGTVSSEFDAVDMGINFEKDSILFYDEMKKFVPSSEHNGIDELIKQEKQHLAKLSSLRTQLG